MGGMTFAATIVQLADRALVRVSGPDARPFLHNLLTQDVESLAPGALRFGALLTPQGRLVHALFLLGEDDAVLLDVARPQREALVQRLTLYRLRAKVTVEPVDPPVFAAWASEQAPGPGWVADPRLPELGWRGYGVETTATGSAQDYDVHRLALGVADPARDLLDDKTYPIEANFDLLNGIDFKKGCFVGQETTSRMKRRGQIKTRLCPIRFDGPSPPYGTEVLAGALRAGEVRSGLDGVALALLRLDRAAAGGLTADGRPVRVSPPDWLAPALQAPEILDRIASDEYA